ncbi:hypothetical protein Ancab_003348 [Ancistrocladus abbreviatus]
MERVAVVKSEKNEAVGLVADGGRGIGGGSGVGCGFNVRMHGGNSSNWGEQPSPSSLSSTVVPPDLLTFTKLGGIWRKKRMSRQRRRRSSLRFNLNVFFPFPPPASVVAASTSSPSSSSASHVPPSLPARHQSTNIKISLPKATPKQRRRASQKNGPSKAENYLPALDTKEGIFITMDDMDGLHVWSFKYRFWPNNNSRMYVLENTGDFVNMHGLQLGDYILVYQDYINLNYVIQAKKAGEQNVYSDQTTYEVHDPVPHDLATSSSSQLTSLNYLQPKVEDTRMSYVYENTFSDDSLLDYLSGWMTNHYTSFRPPDNFGSVDNLSFDDFKAD